MKTLSLASIRELVRSALKEDLSTRGDVTATALIPKDSRSQAFIFAKEHGILCGVIVAAEVFRQLDAKARIQIVKRDGAAVRHGQTVLKVTGKTQAILSAERTALNVIQQLSGIASLTQQYVALARKGNRKVQILDTRKTTPLLRQFEKYAVKCGGGTNHRMGLYDMVLIKDNHLAALAKHPTPILEAVARARKRWPKLKIEVECDTLNQVREAIEAKPNFILLDNMNPATLRKAVRLIKGRCKTEASGGITLKTLKAIASTGVDFISVGALTHSARALDYSLEILS
jgi:nicotinate-nucleotide pyrophosphorylase (carboxylating)